jgi:hypothetical protein
MIGFGSIAISVSLIMFISLLANELIFSTYNKYIAVGAFAALFVLSIALIAIGSRGTDPCLDKILRPTGMCLFRACSPKHGSLLNYRELQTKLSSHTDMEVENAPDGMKFIDANVNGSVRGLFDSIAKKNTFAFGLVAFSSKPTVFYLVGVPTTRAQEFTNPDSNAMPPTIHVRDLEGTNVQQTLDATGRLAKLRVVVTWSTKHPLAVGPQV